jgi:hypothetical protein
MGQPPPLDEYGALPWIPYNVRDEYTGAGYETSTVASEESVAAIVAAEARARTKASPLVWLGGALLLGYLIGR